MPVSVQVRLLNRYFMKKLYLILFLNFGFVSAFGQSFSVEDLVTMTGYPNSKFDSYVARKGYRSLSFVSNDSLAYSYYDKKAKEVHPDDFILKSTTEDRAIIAYQTPSLECFNNLQEELKAEGFHYSKVSGDHLLYQKGNITIKPVKKKDGDKTVYCFVVEKKALPKARDVVFAEDFLQITSHEYLVHVFGESNVRKDNFYFSESEVNKCSVLFPNTNMQVIFIWADEVNNRNISFILVGGQLRAESSLTYHKQIELNAWQSKQGIQTGMTLKALHQLNEEEINIHGWESDQPGVVAGNNKGIVNFKNIGVILNCLDCNEDSYYSKDGMIKASQLIKEGRRVYISTIIILPG